MTVAQQLRAEGQAEGQAEGGKLKGKLRVHVLGACNYCRS